MRTRRVQPLSPVDWLLTPMALCAGGLLVLAMPVEVFGLQAPEPVLAMAPAFAWAVLRPSVWPPLALILLGLLQDVVWGGGLGLWPVCLLTVYALAFSVRRVLVVEDFWALAAWYGAIVAIGFGTGVLLATLASGGVPSLLGVAMQYLVTLALFPLAWLLIDRFEDAGRRRL